MVKKASMGLQGALVKESEVERATSGKLVETAKPKKSPAAKKVQVPVYYPAELHEQLQRLIFAERKNKASFQSLVMEGLDLVLKKRGLPSVSELSEGSSQIKI